MEATLQPVDLEAQLIDDMAGFTHNPLGHAMYSYPWDEQGTILEDIKGPRQWQMEVLDDIGEWLKDPETRFEPYMLAVSSGHGIGKSALFGMVANWGMDTCEDTRIVITANTETQLRTKTSPEMLKWRKLSMTEHWWNAPAMSIYSNQVGHDKSWRADFIPWSEKNPEAFAGLHNKGRRIIILMDEGSAIPDIIWEVVEGALTDEHTEIIWLVFGNPTRSSGRFRECFRKYGKYWKHKKIDSRTVEGTNKRLFNKWAEQYGEDSDFFKVRVRGEFPSQSARQFFSSVLIDEARGKHLRHDQYGFAPVILTCDPAWTGDDELVIGKRQGLHFEILDVMPKNDNDIFVANKLNAYDEEYNADAVFIDGGYGTGIYSAGKTWGKSHWQLVWFNEAAIRKDCVNKRDEMHAEIKEWLKTGGAIPDDGDLVEELEVIEQLPDMGGRIKIMPKDTIRDLIGRSPNKVDVLGLSFAFPVRKRMKGRTRQQRVISDYDPFA